MPVLAAGGQSASWSAANKNVLNIVNQFISQDDQGLVCADDLHQGNHWELQSEGALCARPFYERLAYFLLYTYKSPVGTKNAGKELDGEDTAKNYLGIALNQAANKFRANGTPDSKQFFTCLDQKSSSLDAIWLRGLRANMKREVFDRASRTGAEMDKSEGAAPRTCTRTRTRSRTCTCTCTCTCTYLHLHLHVHLHLRLPLRLR